MLEFVLLALILGILAGTITGIFPGIHINLISALLLSSLALFSSLPPISLAVFIVSMSVTHTFLDFIPSIYLGAPEEDNFLSILPGHQLLKEGKGHEAVLLTLLGSLIAIPIILLFAPIFIYILPKIHPTLTKIIPFILIFISFYLLFREKEFILSLFIFLASGFLGFFALNLPVEQPFLPLLTGLFGISALAVSLKNKVKIKKQIPISFKKIKIKGFLKTTLASIISAPLCSFLPGIGSGHAAIIGSEILPQNNRGFLFLVGAINTIVVSLSFISLYSLGISRTGVASAVKEILPEISISFLSLIIITIILSGISAFFIGIKISKLFSKIINKINYKKLTIFIIFLLISLNLLLTNTLGILILLTSSALGIYTILSGARRINLMGALLIPTIIFYLL